VFLVLAFGTGCDSCKSKRNEAVAYTSVDQVFSEPIFHHCERAAGISVRSLFDTEETKSTGVLNRLIAEAEHPQADVFWSGDPVRPFLLVDRGLVEPYRSPNAATLPRELRAQDGTWTGFAARARVLLVNNDLISEADTPSSIRDLADPRWRGRTAIANPLFGTTTMHVGALFSAWGDEEAKAFLNRLKKNDVRISLGMEKTSDQVRAACLVLAKEDFLTLTKITKKKGGRPSERITFNHPF
jgi:iron(III) transport system substrate-binding protein